jgi:hypothetical protein
MTTETNYALDGSMARALVVHMFEGAGLGEAPFKCTGVTAGGGACQFCGTPILYRFYLRGADGKEFFVGSDCVKKTGDAGLIAYVEKELKRRIQEQKASLAERKIAALEAAIMDEPTAEKIRAIPHPDKYFREVQKKTFLDYIQYFRGLGWRSNTLVKLFDGLVKRGICQKLPRANAKKTGTQQETEETDNG